MKSKYLVSIEDVNMLRETLSEQKERLDLVTNNLKKNSISIIAPMVFIMFLSINYLIKFDYSCIFFSVLLVISMFILIRRDKKLNQEYVLEKIMFNWVESVYNDACVSLYNPSHISKDSLSNDILGKDLKK
jgi:hypothetical protein